MLAITASAAVVGLVPTAASAHGGDETALENLKMQPARTLAQQALAELRVRNDVEEAATRLDAALESKDQGKIDIPLLRRATETLDGGDPEGAIPLLDAALSRPLGAASGEALHESGREFQPGTDTQEVIAIIAGALALLGGALLLFRGRATRPARRDREACVVHRR